MDIILLWLQIELKQALLQFEKAKADIKGYLENQKQIELIDNLTESLKKNAKIEYVNPEYSPEAGKKAIQESIKNASTTPIAPKDDAKKSK